ncbi:MAG: hypothetical protein JO045_08300 [Mycobacterium sp.]|nr:hypothetical protein [Mycobacterium sp.]
MQGKVHLRQPPGGRVLLLTEHRDIGAPAAVRFNELLGLHEHPAAAASRVKDAAVERLQHFHHEPNHRAGRVELASEPALRGSKSGQEVLVNPTKHV